MSWNIVVVVSDTLRTAYLSPYGNDWIHTPNLARFAEQSVRFTNAHPECLRRAVRYIPVDAPIPSAPIHPCRGTTSIPPAGNLCRLMNPQSPNRLSETGIIPVSSPMSRTISCRV